MFYRGKEGQWAYVLHRVTGVGILLFLLAHIIDTMLVMFGPQVYNKVVAIYRLPLFKVGEVALAAAVLYHSLNGIRITLVDFWTGGPQYHKAMFYVVLTLCGMILLPVSFIMLVKHP